MRAVWLVPLLWACGGGGVSTENADVSADTIRVRTGDTTVWVNRALRREDRDDGRTDLVVSGRASRNLTDGTVFVFDDPYGSFSQPSVRTYELAFGTTELTTLIVGVPIFARLHFTPSSSRPDTLTGRIIAGVRLVDFAGTGIFLGGNPEVVSIGGRPVLRLEGTSNRGLLEVDVTAGSIDIPDVRLLTPSEFIIDLPIDHLIALANTEERLQVHARTAIGNITKSARLELSVASLDLTAGDPYEIWPPMTCQDAVRDCLAALPPGETDLSSCGRWIEMQACASATGAIVDDVAFTAAIARANQRLESSLRPDARALVGSERLESFLGNTGLSIESRLEQQFGRRYPDAAARDAALDAEIQAGLDAAYVRPLDLVDPLPSAPNDPIGQRNSAADALLLHLLTLDLAQTEFGRPLDELVRTYRSRHLAALTELREVGPILLASQTEDILGTDWLDAHVEITVNRASGEVTRVYFEID